MAQVAVVGGGVMGLATAWRLATAGIETVLVEAHTVGHERGSSHGPTRIFRTAYDHPAYVRMALQALPLWRELEDGDRLLHVTGGVDLGQVEVLERCADAMRAGSAAVEMLEAGSIRERFPWLEPGGPGLYSPDAAVIDAEATLSRLAERARSAGARIVEGHPATIEVAGERPRVRVGELTLEPQACVLTAGAWAPRLSPVRLPVSVTEEHVFYTPTEATAPVIWRGERFFYTVPPIVPGAQTKAGEHGGGRQVDPDAARERPDPARAEALSEWLSRTIPSAGALSSGDSCLYTTTPDEHFIIDRVGPVVIGSPCSGHGFKFAPLIGEALACLATDRPPAFDTSLFTLGRAQ